MKKTVYSSVRLFITAISVCHHENTIAQAKLEAATILPHGDFAWDPTLLPTHTRERRAADAIAQGAREVGYWLNHIIDPDLILLSSPHGTALTNDFGFFLGSKASGTAMIGSDLPHYNSSYPVKVPSIQLESNLTRILVHEGTRDNLNVSGILVSPDDSQDEPLHWGEVIPLLLIGPSTLRQHIILTHPLRRHIEIPSEFVPELLRLGTWLGRFLDRLTQRVAVVISGDLSHTHSADGPYGYSNTSKLFDSAIGEWAQDPCGRGQRSLWRAAKDWQPDALSCGFTGFVMLHGLLCGCCGNENSRWLGRVVVNRNATYYGMMAATFAKESFEPLSRSGSLD